MDSETVVLLGLLVPARLPQGVGRVEDDLVLGGRQLRRPHVVVGRVLMPLYLRQELT